MAMAFIGKVKSTCIKMLVLSPLSTSDCEIFTLKIQKIHTKMEQILPKSGPSGV